MCSKSLWQICIMLLWIDDFCSLQKNCGMCWWQEASRTRLRRQKKRGDISRQIFPFLGNRPMFGNHLVAKLQPEDYDMPMSNDAPQPPSTNFYHNFWRSRYRVIWIFFSTFSRWMNATNALMEAFLRAGAGLALGNPAAAPARLLRFRKHGGRRNWGANVSQHLLQRRGSKTNKFHGCYLAVLTVVHILRRQETSAAD